MKQTLTLLAALLLMPVARLHADGSLPGEDKLREYVGRFNAEDREVYGKGAGLRVLVDGNEIVHSDTLSRVSGRLRQ